MKIESVTGQIIRINGGQWMVYALVSYPGLAAMPQPFTFFSKRDAVAFCKNHGAQCA